MYIIIINIILKCMCKCLVCMSWPIQIYIYEVWDADVVYYKHISHIVPYYDWGNSKLWKMSIIICDWLRQQKVMGEDVPHYQWLAETTWSDGTQCPSLLVIGWGNMKWWDTMSLIISDWLRQQEVMGHNVPHYWWLAEATGSDGTQCPSLLVIGWGNRKLWEKMSLIVDWMKQQDIV